MSSFLNTPKHFNSIEFSIQNLFWGSNFYCPYSFKAVFPELYDKKHYSTERIEKTVTGIVDTLRELSVLCVTLQYKHHYTGSLDNEIAGQKTMLLTDKNDKTSLSKVGLYKAINCAMYQIETDHLKELRALTPEEENCLFFFKELSKTLAEDIVNELKEYKDQKWSI